MTPGSYQKEFLIATRLKYFLSFSRKDTAAKSKESNVSLAKKYPENGPEVQDQRYLEMIEMQPVSFLISIITFTEEKLRYLFQFSFASFSAPHFISHARYEY